MTDLPDELAPEALSPVLGYDVEAVSGERIGSGQMGVCYRVQITHAGGVLPAVVKLPAADPAARAMVAGSYRAEVRFYRDLLPTLRVDTPALHGATMPDDDGNYVLVLSDLAPAQQGDQVAGCSPAEANSAARNLIGLHAPRWGDPTLIDDDWLKLPAEEDIALLAELYPSTADIFFEVVGDLINDDTRATIRACGEVIVPWSFAHGERYAPVHGDYRLDNLLFSPKGDHASAVDWQTLSLGLPTRDLSYLLGTGLSVDDRRSHERALVENYHAGLAEQGVRDYTFDECWNDYALTMIQGPLVALFGCAYGEKTERGQHMFAAMVNRCAQAMQDLGTLDLAKSL